MMNDMFGDVYVDVYVDVKCTFISNWYYILVIIFNLYILFITNYLCEYNLPHAHTITIVNQNMINMINNIIQLTRSPTMSW
jgi:hypothetical protein